VSVSEKQSLTERELRDWRLWLLLVVVAFAIGRDLLTRAGGLRTLLIGAAAVLTAGGAGTWLALRYRRDQGFPTKATAALAGQLPAGGRPPRLQSATQEGEIWELAWRLPNRRQGPLLLQKVEEIGQELDAEVRIWLDRRGVLMRAGTALIPEVVFYDEFYRQHQQPAGELVVGLGESRWGPQWADLVELPHLLVAGTTNFGKSVMVRQMLSRLVTLYPPTHLRLALVDFKRVELNLFEALPHVMPPEGQAAPLSVARDIKSYLELLQVLNEALNERTARFEQAAVENLQTWNRRAMPSARLPYVVLAIDELAEVSVEEALDTEDKKLRSEGLALLSRFCRLGRALGFHVIAATQRPAADTVPGPIKSQLPARIGFNVPSGLESRIIFGEENSAAGRLPPRQGLGIWQWGEPVVFQGILLERDPARRLLSPAIAQEPSDRAFTVITQGDSAT